MATLSEKQVAELKEEFGKIDTSVKGAVAPAVIRSYLESKGLAPSEEKWTSLLADANLDDNGNLDFSEFAVIVAAIMGKMGPSGAGEEEPVEEPKPAAPKNPATLINAAELKHLLLSLGEKLTDEEIQEMIQEADDDGDGLVDYDAFVKMMMAS